MLRVGLIGLGYIGKSCHLPVYEQLIKENGPLVLEACCDIRTECLDGLEHLRLYNDAFEMLEKEKGKLDIIDICVPTFLHAEFTTKALEAGYHVLCEKPMARTVEQAEMMIEASKRTGKTLMNAYCCRFHTAIRMIRDLIQSKEFGAVRSAEFYREGGPGPLGWNNWFRDGELSGGAMLDLHIHDVDLMRYFFGVPNAVSAAASTKFSQNGGYDALSALFYFDNNMFVHASCDWTIACDRFNTRTVRVNFENGYIFLDRTPGRQAFLKVAADGTITDYMDHIAFDAFYNEITYFADCIINNKPLTECPPEESIDSVKIIMAEKESADRNGERITI